LLFFMFGGIHKNVWVRASNYDFQQALPLSGAFIIYLTVKKIKIKRSS